MRSVLTVTFILLSPVLFAQQFSSEVFHKGFLITTDKDTIRGELKYDLDANVLTVIGQGKTRSFSSHKIFYFEIFDSLLKNYRQFYSIPFEVNVGYKIPVFFELIYEDRLSLLAREHIVSQAVSTSSAYWGGGSTTRLVLKYSFYFLDNEGNITYFSGKKKELLAFMGKKQSVVKDFIKDNKLDVDELADLVRIIAFYNSI